MYRVNEKDLKKVLADLNESHEAYYDVHAGPDWDDFKAISFQDFLKTYNIKRGGS